MVKTNDYKYDRVHDNFRYYYYFQYSYGQKNANFHFFIIQIFMGKQIIYLPLLQSSVKRIVTEL